MKNLGKASNSKGSKKVQASKVKRVLTRITYTKSRFEVYSIPKTVFSRCARAQDPKKLKWNKKAMEALQLGSEKYLTETFSDAKMCAAHAKRQTIKREDIHLVLRLKYRLV